MSRYMKVMMQRIGRLPLIGLALAATAATAGCAGDNQFGPVNATEDRPVVVSVSVPDATIEGGRIDLRVEGAGQRNIVQFDVRVRRAFEVDTVIGIDPPRNVVVRDIVLNVPRPVQDTVVLLRITARDAIGLVSEVVEATVSVSDVSLPTVRVSLDPPSADAGEVVEVTVDAEDNVGLESVGFRVVTAEGDTILEQVPLPSNEAKRDSVTFEFEVPEIEPTTLRVEGIALDLFGRSGTGAADLVVQDQRGPRIEDLTTSPPQTVPLGDSILVQARIRDASGIASVSFRGVAQRGDPEFGTDQVITRFDERVIQFPRPAVDTLPKDIRLSQFLSSEDEATSEQVTIIVQATDDGGNVSADSVAVFVGGPSIEIEFPTDGEFAGLNDILPVGIVARDNTGLDTVRLDVLGDNGQLVERRLFDFTRGATTLEVEPVLTTPGTPAELTLVATAVNVGGVRSVSDSITVFVVAVPPLDTVAPFLDLEVDPLPEPPGGGPPRVEFFDTLEITVTARDNAGGAGLRRVGYVVVIERGGSTQILAEDETFSPRSITQEKFRRLPTFESVYSALGFRGQARLDRLTPDTFRVRVHGFAVDTAGVVTCATLTEFGPGNADTTIETNDCNTVELGGREFFFVPDVQQPPQTLVLVRGRTVFLGNRSAVIADVEPDRLRNRVYLSNITDNAIEVLQLDPDPNKVTFGDQVLVGSKPWGIFLNNRGDTLIVANSGGTNLSFVAVGRHLPNPREDLSRRLLTPNVTLFELTEVEDENGQERYQPPTLIDFSDRPQFLAQDSQGRILYSTVPTEAANTGTIRIVVTDPAPLTGGSQEEVAMLIPSGSLSEGIEDQFAIARVDSVDVKLDSVQLFTHRPGFPNQVLASGFHRFPFGAAANLTAQLAPFFASGGTAAAEQSLLVPIVASGSWNVPALAMSDTTFVAASSDRNVIAFGEGATAPTGRIILWRADPATIDNLSSGIQIVDLINNASERVLGVGLNEDGSLGVARGTMGAYFFTNDLRLQGLFTEGISEGGGGAAFHPDHQSVITNNDNAAAFIAGPEQTVEVINTAHFFRVNSIAVKDNVIGPMKAIFPLAADNNGQGVNCSGLDCIVVKLFGVTESGGMVVIDVRRRDLRQ